MAPKGLAPRDRSVACRRAIHQPPPHWLHAKTPGVWVLAPIAAGILTQTTQLTPGPTGLHSQPLSENAGSSLGLADVSSCPSRTFA